jgi:hypothetical protein
MPWGCWKNCLAVVAICALGVLAVGAVSHSRTPVWTAAKCAVGETLDPATNICMPVLPSNIVQVTTPVGGGLPEVDGVPCTGQNSYECVGLGEQQLASGPTPNASSTLTAQSGAPKPTTVPVAPPP